jgi:hypothetical protein
MKKKSTLLLLVFSCFFACKKPKKQPYGNKDIIQNNIFENKEIGWKMEIPKNWKIIKRKESHKAVLEGYEKVESTTGEKYDKNQFTNILKFEKDMFNFFSSTIEKYDKKVHGKWSETNKKTKEIIYETYLKQGIKVDSSATKTENINGVEFETYELTLYNQKNEIALNQIMFSQYINGFDFGININFNNEEDRELLLKHWRESKFMKK